MSFLPLPWLTLFLSFLIGDPLEALRLIESEKVTNISGVPSMVWGITEHPKAKEFDTSSLEGFFYGGAPSAKELPIRFNQMFKGALPGQGYGMTWVAKAKRTFSPRRDEEMNEKVSNVRFPFTAKPLRSPL